MGNELVNLIFTEKYRPQMFEDLVLQNKQKLLNYLKNPKGIPSFLFTSRSAGTGKTSTGKLITKYLKCDLLKLNASDERGIDVIREKIKVFVRGQSSNTDIKRMVFLDEADGLTSIAQNSLRNMMEEYNNNAFFVLTCNNISKVIEPIRSRCIEFHFDKPNKESIFKYLKAICAKEEIGYIDISLVELMNLHYPDIRNMVKTLQDVKTSEKTLEIFLDTIQNYGEIWQNIINKEIDVVKDKVFKAEIDPVNFNKWIFRYIFDTWEKIGFEKASKIIYLLAENEKAFVTGINQDIVFLANCLKIMEIL